MFKWDNYTSDWDHIGSDIGGEADGGRCGESVSLSDNGAIVAIRSPNNEGNGDTNGNVRIFRWNNSTFICDRMGADIDGKQVATILVNLCPCLAMSRLWLLELKEMTQSGHDRIFKWNNATYVWDQLDADID